MSAGTPSGSSRRAGRPAFPGVPALAAGLPADVVQVVPTRYRNPADLAPGGVLVGALRPPGSSILHEEGVRVVGRAVGAGGGAVTFEDDLAETTTAADLKLGRLRHTGGVTPAAGLYALGLNLLRRRNSSFIDGVAQEAEELTRHLVERRAGPDRSVA